MNELLVQLQMKMEAFQKDAALQAEKGNKEINDERTEDVLETKASVVATGCPFCNTMMTDGVKSAEKSNTVDVQDIAEMIAKAANILPE